MQRWLRACRVTGTPEAAVRLHAAVLALRACAEPYWVSPLPLAGRAPLQTLAVGQLALVDEDDRGDTIGYEDSYALVQGVDTRGTCGGEWRPGGSGWVHGECEECRSGICSSMEHAPAAPVWNEERAEFELAVRLLQRVCMDGSDAPSQIFFPEGSTLTTIRLPALFYPVRPLSLIHI